MYSIKPGRGPSWGGVIGGILASIFGIFWTIGASSAGAPPFFVMFGVVFVLGALGGAIYHFYNATSDNRLSDYDITGPGEEIDPLDARRNIKNAPTVFKGKPSFCPYCGTQLQKTFEFCPRCGKDV
jgi:hypothetical protein